MTKTQENEFARAAYATLCSRIRGRIRGMDADDRRQNAVIHALQLLRDGYDPAGAIELGIRRQYQGPDGRRRRQRTTTLPAALPTRDTTHDYLDGLPTRLRRLAAMLASGCTQRDAAELLGLSRSAVCHMVEELRRQYHVE